MYITISILLTLGYYITLLFFNRKKKREYALKQVAEIAMGATGTGAGDVAQLVAENKETGGPDLLGKLGDLVVQSVKEASKLKTKITTEKEIENSVGDSGKEELSKSGIISDKGNFRESVEIPVMKKEIVLEEKVIQKNEERVTNDDFVDGISEDEMLKEDMELLALEMSPLGVVEVNMKEVITSIERVDPLDDIGVNELLKMVGGDEKNTKESQE